jgi:hypothetical protein
VEGIDFSLDNGTTVSVSKREIEPLIEALWQLAATIPGSLSCAGQLSQTIARDRACRQRHLHGKEGVDGSSPSEGFSSLPAQQ